MNTDEGRLFLCMLHVNSSRMLVAMWRYLRMHIKQFRTKLLPSSSGEG